MSLGETASTTPNTNCGVLPSHLSSFLYRRVSVCTAGGGGQPIEGGVVAIDPVSNSFVLISLGSDNKDYVLNRETVTLIPDVDIASVSLLDTEPSLETRLRECVARAAAVGGHGQLEPLAEEERLERVARLEQFLTQHGLAVTKSGVNIVVQGCVTLVPPYRPQDCRATNEIVLARVSHLLGGM